MNNFLTEYKESIKSRGIAGLIRSAQNNLIRLFYTQGKKIESDNPEEYDSTKLIPRNKIVPGHIYTFIYKSDKPAVYSRGKECIEFTDKLPLCLVTSIYGNIIQGINLNLIPRDVRVIILNLIQNIDPDFFNTGHFEMVKKAQAPVSQRLMQFFMKPDMHDIIYRYFKMFGDVDPSVMFRTYRINNIKQINRLEIWQWKQISFLTYQDSIKQDILDKIYSLSGLDKIKLN